MTNTPPGTGGAPQGAPPRSPADQDPREREAVLVVNPAAGRGADPEAVAAAVRGLLPARLLVTQRPGDARRFGRAAADAGARRVVVAGGDGTVHDVVAGLRDAVDDPALRAGGEEPAGGPLPELGILPTGTGNDLARCLGIPLDWEAALGLLRGEHPVRRLDLMEVTRNGGNETAVNAVVMGSGGRVGEILDPEEKERWGPLSYLRSAAEVILQLEPVALILAVDGEPPRTLEAINVVVANGRYAARGIPVAPGADPSDGLLDLVVIRDAGLREVLGMVPPLLHESDPDHPAYHHRRIRTVRLSALGDGEVPVSLDGETHRARDITIRVLPSRLPVRVPNTS